MQEMLKVDQPDSGDLFHTMQVPDGGRIDTSQLIAPRVEAEIAFVLDRTPEGPDPNRFDVLGATRAVAPALEVIDSRVADWRITIADTIADNASSALFVLGEERPLEGLDLEQLEVALSVGDATEHGRGDAVLTHPAEAIVWLAVALDFYYGERLAPGDVVLPGALCRALPVEAGDSAEADFGPLGTVGVSFT